MNPLFQQLGVLLAFVMYCSCSNAQNIVDDKAVQLKPIEYAISDHWTVPKHKVTFVSAPVPDSISISTEPNVYWLKFNLVNKSSDTSIIIELDKWSEVELWIGDEWIGKSGTLIPLNERSLKHGNKVYLEITLPIGEQLEVITKLIAKTDNIVIPENFLAIGRSKNYVEEEEAQGRMYFNFFLGIFFFILFYNLFVMIVTKSKAYLLYVILIAINFFALPHNFGYTLETFSFMADYPKWHPFIDVLFSSFLGLAILAFASEFLRIKKNFPRTYTIFQVIRVLLVLVLLPSIFGETLMASGISLLIGLFTFGVVLTVSIRAYRRKLPSSNYFVLAFSFFLIGLFTFILKEVGVLPVNVITKYAMQFGTTIEALLFAIALGDRINKLQSKNKEQQAELINQLKKNEGLQKKVNRELEEKVKERTVEIELKNIELLYSNKQITDSLNYAKNIQTAILTSHNALDRNDIDNFVLFKPRDIVSGDFYWSHQVNEETILWVTADCTGHGVPGALMSIIGNVLLNKVIVEKGISKVDVILSQLRDGINDTINSKDDNRNRLDGIDMSVCRLNRRTGSLTFAGANSRMWIVNGQELREFKGDKQPVGFHHDMSKPFTEQVVELKKGDCVYTFSDGFPDQFGGVQDKKYGYNSFRQLLRSVASLPLENQKTELENALNDWMKDTTQLDDITLIGVKN